MPYRYSSLACPGVQIYIGFDKYENEDLIRYAWPGDLWFHVDKHSSAHVYLRPPAGSALSLDSLPPELVREAAQLTKENSIEGCKLSNVVVIYTPADNLRKDGTMDTGTVGFRAPKLVRRTMVPEKDRELLRALLKTRTEDKTTDLRRSLEEHLKELRREERRAQAARDAEERARREKEEARRKAHSYDELWGAKGQALAAEQEAARQAEGGAGGAGELDGWGFDGAPADAAGAQGSSAAFGPGADPFGDFI